MLPIAETPSGSARSSPLAEHSPLHVGTRLRRVPSTPKAEPSAEAVTPEAKAAPSAEAVTPKAVPSAIEVNTVTPKAMPSAKAVPSALEKNMTVTTLNLLDNGIGDQGAERIAVALEKNSTVTAPTRI